MLSEDEIISQQLYSMPYSKFYDPVTVRSEENVVRLLESHIGHLLGAVDFLRHSKGALEEEVLRGRYTPRALHTYRQIFKLNESRISIFRNNQALIQKLRENFVTYSQSS